MGKGQAKAYTDFYRGRSFASANNNGGGSQQRPFEVAIKFGTSNFTNSPNKEDEENKLEARKKALQRRLKKLRSK